MGGNLRYTKGVPIYWKIRHLPGGRDIGCGTSRGGYENEDKKRENV
jgi:hypothetical protein